MAANKALAAAVDGIAWHLPGRPMCCARGLRFLRFPRLRPPSERTQTQLGCSEFALPNQFLRPTISLSLLLPPHLRRGRHLIAILPQRCTFLNYHFLTFFSAIFPASNRSLKAWIISHTHLPRFLCRQIGASIAADFEVFHVCSFVFESGS